jgi:hypothetical protein
VTDDSDLTEELLRATGRLTDALRGAQEALGQLIAGLGIPSTQIEQDVRIDEVMRTNDFEAYRIAVDEGMEHFEAWRRTARGAAVRSALAARMNLTEIADEFASPGPTRGDWPGKCPLLPSPESDFGAVGWHHLCPHITGASSGDSPGLVRVLQGCVSSL